MDVHCLATNTYWISIFTEFVATSNNWVNVLPTGFWPSVVIFSTGLSPLTSNVSSTTQTFLSSSFSIYSVSTRSSSQASTASVSVSTHGACSSITSSWCHRIRTADTLLPPTITTSATKAFSCRWWKVSYRRYSFTSILTSSGRSTMTPWTMM